MSRNSKTDSLISRVKGNHPVKILFVCLGNICRSPAAEGIMEDLANERGIADRFMLDSAGLYGGHAGEHPDNRMRIHARKRGYELTHRSRPVKASDFDNFDIIVGMDANNLRGLKNLAPTVEDEEKIVMMTDFINGFPHYDHVPDPYYEGASGFELVLDMLEEGCANLIDSLSTND